MKRIGFAMALGLGIVTLHARQAAALGVDVAGRIELYNETNEMIAIPASGIQVSGYWLDQSTVDSGALSVFGGSPPRVLGPGQRMIFGSHSRNDFFSTNGTGGSVTIPLGGGVTATLNWSVPWLRFNGNPPGTFCNGWVSINAGSSTFSPPITASGGDLAEGDNTCVFQFGLTKNGSEGSGSVTSPLMNQGQSLSWNTSQNSVSSSDGSTTLTLTASHALQLYNSQTGQSWSNGDQSGVVTIMQADGNLVSYDVNGNPTWSSGTFNHAGSNLQIFPSQVQVESPYICVGPPFARSCFQIPLWTANAQ